MALIIEATRQNVINTSSALVQYENDPTTAFRSLGFAKIAPVRNVKKPPSITRTTCAFVSALWYQPYTLSYSLRANWTGFSLSGLMIFYPDWCFYPCTVFSNWSMKGLVLVAIECLGGMAIRDVAEV